MTSVIRFEETQRRRNSILIQKGNCGLNASACCRRRNGGLIIGHNCLTADRARCLGAHDHNHFVFPFCVRRNDFDPIRPMSSSGIKKPFDEVRAAAGVKWLRIHDLRHTAITRMAEEGTPISTIMAMAGHVSAKMTAHYTHISDQHKRFAAERAFGSGKGSRKAAYPALPGRQEEMPGTPAPQPSSAPVGAMGIVMVASEPAIGAAIEIDGVFIGNTPSAPSIQVGIRTIRVTKRGFEPWECQIMVTPGGRQSIAAELRQANCGALSS